MSEPSIDSRSSYLASASERKRAIMMYLFFGIFMILMKKNFSIFEVYHCKQATGRWIVFILVVVFGSVLFFVPYLGYLSFFAMFMIALVWGMFVKQARDGYSSSQPSSFLGLFVGLGGWFFDLFEYKFEVLLENVQSSQTSSLDQLPPRN